MPRQCNKILLFGGSGQIGEALRLCAGLGTPAPEVRTVPWTKIGDEQLCSDTVRLRRCLEEAAAQWDDFDLVFAAGITDPKAPLASLIHSNVAFPLAVIEATAGRAGLRYMTLGTVFEQFPGFASGNPYAESKKQLWEHLQARESLIEAGRLVHLRLHTVYGGKPKPYMFLGQMIEALERGAVFRMSSGQQLREYHHVHDVAGALLAILAQDWQYGTAPLVLSSGAPVRLLDLATAVFQDCGHLDLLKIGAIPSAPADNHGHVFPRSDASLLPFYRDPIVGVTEYVRSHCAGRCAKGAD